MTELVVNCFAVDGFAPHEMSVFARPAQPLALVCTKNPQDVLAVRPLLAIDGGLHVIFMQRDPRDVVVSRHARDPGRYWANLRLWREWDRAARRMDGHPRFTTVRYEDLVTRPDAAQDELTRRMPFLVRRAAFADFHRLARPSARALEALGGLRPLGGESIGAWRREKPRLAAQLALHGPIAADLIALGYERDDAWLRELDGVAPEHAQSRWPERSGPWRRTTRALRRAAATLRYAAGAGPRVRLDVPGDAR